jgi:hypothetical protein
LRLIRPPVTAKPHAGNHRKDSGDPQRAVTPISQFKLRATHSPAAPLLLIRPVELLDNGGRMKRLRPASAATFLLLTLAPAANAQDKAPKDHALQMIARSEAKHVRSRQNLMRILRDQPNFWIELQAIAKRLRTEPAWLLNVMASESLFNPAARNGLPGQTATGLLQFIEDTARGLGTTTEAIRRMSPVEQLRLIEKYLTPFRGRLNSMADVYSAVFRGFIAEGGDTSVVAPLNNTNKEWRIYSLNKWLDFNDDGKITKGELAVAAFSIGRFQPADRRADRNLIPNSIVVSDQKPEIRRTRSIYVRSLNDRH